MFLPNQACLLRCSITVLSTSGDMFNFQSKLLASLLFFLPFSTSSNLVYELEINNNNVDNNNDKGHITICSNVEGPRGGVADK